MRIYVAGSTGMVGSAVVRKLKAQGREVITTDRSQLDLTNSEAVGTFLSSSRPDIVIMAAAKVGGIYANNTYPADFIFDNIMMQTNIIKQSHQNGVEKLVFLGSSCIYPKDAAQPMPESALLTGSLEATNEPYAIAKISGIKLCESFNRQFGTDFRSVMPTNLYGPGDNFHLENSHVIPALIRRFDEAVKAGAGEVVIWGTGTPRREFLHVDDMADGVIFVMDLPDQVYRHRTAPMLSHINIGAGYDLSIFELASLIAEVVGYRGKIITDPTKLDGSPQKLMDTGLINGLGWRPKISLLEGLEQTYQWYVDNINFVRC